MPITSRIGFAASLCAATLVALPPAQAQVTLKPDGQWRSLLTVGANAARGNNNTTALNVRGEGARLTDYDRFTLTGELAYARNGGALTTERYSLGSQYNRDLSDRWFGFGSADTLRDKLANVSSRYSAAGGVGLHLIEGERNSFDVSAGLGYTYDSFVNPAEVAGAFRDEYGRFELVLAQESNHKLTDTTSFRQKFSIYPTVRDAGRYRAVFDTGLTVAMTPTINLTAGLSVRYNSDPGTDIKKADTQFVTGVSFRFD